MIRVRKPPQAPEVLRTRGKNKRRAHSRDYTRHAADYQAGSKTFDFDSGIYGHATVKTSLSTGKGLFRDRDKVS